MPGYNPYRGLKLRLPLKLNGGGSGPRLNDDPDLKPFGMGVFVGSFCGVFLCVFYSLAIILLRRKKADCFTLCWVVFVLWLFLAVPSVCFRSVIVPFLVPFPEYTH